MHDHWRFSVIKWLLYRLLSSCCSGSSGFPIKYSPSVFPSSDQQIVASSLWMRISMVNLLVSRVPRAVTEEKIRELFEKFGTVTDCHLVKDFAFVHMDSEQAAETAVKGLHNFGIESGVLSVEKLQSGGDRRGGPDDRRDGGGEWTPTRYAGPPPPYFVGGPPPQWGHGAPPPGPNSGHGGGAFGGRGAPPIVPYYDTRYSPLGYGYYDPYFQPYPPHLDPSRYDGGQKANDLRGELASHRPDSAVTVRDNSTKGTMPSTSLVDLSEYLQCRNAWQSALSREKELVSTVEKLKKDLSKLQAQERKKGLGGLDVLDITSAGTANGQRKRTYSRSRSLHRQRSVSSEIEDPQDRPATAENDPDWDDTLSTRSRRPSTIVGTQRRKQMVPRSIKAEENQRQPSKKGAHWGMLYEREVARVKLVQGDKEVELSNYALPPKENGLCWWFERCSSKSVNSKPGRRFCTFHHNIFNRLEAEVVKE